jgi:hypothetical protein
MNLEKKSKLNNFDESKLDNYDQSKLNSYDESKLTNPIMMNLNLTILGESK